jgi:hypothetical protein
MGLPRNGGERFGPIWREIFLVFIGCLLNRNSGERRELLDNAVERLSFVEMLGLVV